jgi:3-phosphoshikimate 1-carboxyvinyltransferase
VEFVASAPPAPLSGSVIVPGDKSLSHRGVLFAAMSQGTSHVTGVLDSEDVRASISAVRALGAAVDVSQGPDGSLSVTVAGWGARGPRHPAAAVECGNSGTTARLLLGILAGWEIEATLTGDASLSRRPMDRVIGPLSAMGARFSSQEGTLPVTVRGGRLAPIEYESPVASAQVKTAVLLAGLRAEGRTSVSEPALSRDHTELLLPAFGVEVGRDRSSRTAWVEGPDTPRAADFAVPGDPSSAAFMIAAALLVPGSRVTLPGVALNPTRTGFLRVLERMGADLTIVRGRPAGSEPVGTVGVAHMAALHGTTVVAEEIPSLGDEVPVLALVATQAAGVTRFCGVSELRVKESDRLGAIVAGLGALGASVDVDGEDLLVQGPVRLTGARLDSRGDHRLAMVWALAGLAAEDAVTVDGFEAVNVSYPGFVRDLVRLGAGWAG